MWKIKDPVLKRKMNQFISDEGIDEVCRNEMSDSSTYIFFSFEDDAINFRIDKSFFEEFPEYNPDDWNPFPKMTPKSDIVYLVTLKTPSGQTVVTTSLYLASVGWMKNFDLEVIAFREFPKPY